MLSFSTCWNSGRHTDGAAMIQEILDLGFENVELGHGIRLSLVDGILKMHEQGKMKITSLHNFCPLPVEITRASPDCYQISAASQSERERALRHTFQTIDFAKRLGAKFVVMHLGSVPVDDYTGKLVKMAEVGMMASNQFVRTKLEAVKARESQAANPFFRAKESFKRIVAFAEERGIKLGVESRHSYEEIPNEPEMMDVLGNFAAPTVGYWHDFGHVQVKHNMSFLDHAAWLQKVSPRLIGCHLHDTKWPGRDHMAPFDGNIEYEKLLPFVPPGMLFVYEMSPRRTREEIVASAAKWKERFPQWT